ncbi:MAG: LytR C-terminal domain-containing protein [Burkholderiaceae bacterium]
MYTLRPLVLAMGACLLQACVATPTKQAEVTEFAIQPVLRVRHSSDQNAATYYQLGKYHTGHGNLDFARSAYEASIMLDGKQLEARNALAALHATQGRLDEAKTILLGVIADFPEVSHPYNNLGYVNYLQNNYDAAMMNLQRALVLDSGNERARNNLHAVQIALAPPPAPSTQTITAQRSEAIKPAEPVLTSVADTRSQGLVIMSPPSEPQTRMEVVQILPNVYELRQKSAVETVLTELKVEKTSVTLAHSLARPVRAMEKALEKAMTKATASVSATKASRIEVANGNGVNGMAKRISKVLSQQGIAVSLLTNEPPYKQQDTKIQYRPGYEQTAMRLKNALQGHAVVVSSPNLSGNSDVRLVLGKDVLNQMTLIEELANVSAVALNRESDR